MTTRWAELKAEVAFRRWALKSGQVVCPEPPSPLINLSEHEFLTALDHPCLHCKAAL